MNVLTGYTKGTLSDNYLLSAAGGHIPLGNSSGSVPLSNNTLNKDLFADKARTLPYFTIPSSGELSKDANDATKLIPKYIKIGTINIPLKSWYRGSIMLIFHDYENYKLNGDILMIQCTASGNKVGALPAIRWKTKHDKSTEDSIIISKVDDNTYDLYLEAKFSWMTFYVYYLTKEEGVFNFSIGSWSLVEPNPITTRSTLLNVSSEALTLSPEYVGNLNDVARDTFIDGGFLATNTPYSNYFTGISLSNSKLKYKYLFGFSTTGIPFVRYNNNSTWLPWKLLAFTSDISSLYVTLTTDLTITGLKTFESNSSTTGVSLILKNKGWAGSMQTAMDFYNGSKYEVPNARISTLMNGIGSAGGTLIFYTQTKASANPNPNGLVERFRIGDDNTSKLTGDLTVDGKVNDVTIKKLFVSDSGETQTTVYDTLNVDTDYVLASIRYGGGKQSVKDPWLANNYSAGVGFGGTDTKGALSLGMYAPNIKFAAADSNSGWWLLLTGTNLKSYNLDLFTTLTKTNELLGNYLPLSGGIMTGHIQLTLGLASIRNNSDMVLLAHSNSSSYSGVADGTNTVVLGNATYNTLIRSNNTDLLHHKAGTNHVILDAANYNTYTVKKDGTGASGTWAISAIGVQDYGSTTDRMIKIGYSGTAATTATHFAVYQDNGTKIKDMSVANVKTVLNIPTKVSLLTNDSNYATVSSTLGKSSIGIPNGSIVKVTVPSDSHYLITLRGTQGQRCALLYVSGYGSGGTSTRLTVRVVYSHANFEYYYNEASDSIGGIYVKNAFTGSVQNDTICVTSLNKSDIPTLTTVTTIPTGANKINSAECNLLTVDTADNYFVRNTGSLKNPKALTIFGINYDGSVAQTITANTMISTLSAGTSDVTDYTEILTSYASDNGFADTNAPNKVYKRGAIKVYNYIKGKLDSVYLKNSEGATKLNSFHSTRPTTPDTQYTDNALRYYLATGSMTTNKPATDAYILQFSWDNSGYNSWLSIPSGSSSNTRIQYRTTVGSSHSLIGSWVDVLDSNMLKIATAKTNLGWDNTTANKLIPTIGTLAYWTGAYNDNHKSNLQYCVNGEIIGTNNYTSYTVKKDGTGASGTWGINITGSSSSCTGNAVTATTASNVTVGTGSTNAYRAIVVHNGNALYAAGTTTGKPCYNYSTGDIKAKSFTTDGGLFIGAVTSVSNISSAASSTGNLTITLSGLDITTSSLITLKLTSNWLAPVDEYLYLNINSNGNKPIKLNGNKVTLLNAGTYTLLFDGSNYNIVLTSYTTYGIATASKAGLVKPNSVITKPTINTASTTSGKYYHVLMSNDGNMFVNVPWEKGSYTLPLATNGTRGGIQIGYSESGTNYAVKLSSEKAYVTVPWTDTKVKQTAKSDNVAYPLLLSPNGHTSGNAGEAYYDSEITLNPSTNTITANINGNVTGSSGSVTNNLIIKLNSGTTEGTNLFTFNGSAAKTINITPASINALASNGTASAAIRLSSKGDNTNANTLCFYSASISSTTLSAMNSWTRPTDGSNNAMVLRMYKTASTGHDIYAASDKDSLWHRNSSNTTSKWAKILDSENCYGVYQIMGNLSGWLIDYIKGKNILGIIGLPSLSGTAKFPYFDAPEDTVFGESNKTYLITSNPIVVSASGMSYAYLFVGKLTSTRLNLYITGNPVDYIPNNGSYTTELIIWEL